MDNATKNKVSLALYIVLALIVVSVLCMTVFSITKRSKKPVTDIPKITDAPATSADSGKASSKASEKTEKPDETEKESAPEDEDVNGIPETDEPSKNVSVPVKIVYTLPVQNGYLLKGYDIDMPVYSLTMNDYRVHAGIDISSEPGEPVMAVAEGIVQNVYNDPMMGNCISIAHPNGLVTYYMGLSDEVYDGIAEGAPVYCGQEISSVGDSTLIEIAEEPHLHFEAKMNGVYVDPLSFISYEKAASAEPANNYEG